ncbi:MAG: ribonuclease P protein component [Beijerinckiaceae bacterium]
MAASVFQPENGFAVMERLKKRRDFLNAQKGRRANSGLFSVQAIQRTDEGTARCGFTVSKRVSLKAVVRNRIRRRLKEAVRIGDGTQVNQATDYVVVARLDTLHAPFSRIRTELTKAFAKLSQKPDNTLERPDTPATPKPNQSRDHA